MLKTQLTCFAAAVLTLICAAPSMALKDDGVGTVTYSGKVLMRIRTGAGGYTAEQRAEAIQDRLNPILSLPNLTPDDITVKQTRPYQDANIYVRDRLLITVDQKLAQANGNNDPGTLAAQWASRMRAILPRLSVKQEPGVAPAPHANP